MRALDARLAVPAALHGDGVAVLVVDVGEAGDDEVLGPQVQLLEVVAGVQGLAGLEAQPAHVVRDGIHVLGLFGDRVGVVEAQLAHPTELLCDAEVDTDGLRMADVQVPVWLGWEPCLHAPAERALLVVGEHEVAHEVRSSRRIRGIRGGGRVAHQFSRRVGTTRDGI